MRSVVGATPRHRISLRPTLKYRNGSHVCCRVIDRRRGIVGDSGVDDKPIPGGTVGALIIRVGFRDLLYYSYNKEPQTLFYLSLRIQVLDIYGFW